jgi:hypothetical protein
MAPYLQQSVSVSCQSPFFIKRRSNQPGVHVNYLNVIFTGNLRETHQGCARAVCGAQAALLSTLNYFLDTYFLYNLKQQHGNVFL